MIMTGLIKYLSPANALSKEKRATRQAMWNLNGINICQYGYQLTYLNNFLPMFTGEDKNNKMEDEELNYIPLHSVLYDWDKQAYFQ